MFVQDNENMTMLHLINLHVIDQIFKVEAQIKLGAMAQMLYINCLMHHFRDKPVSAINAMAFEILETDISYDKYKHALADLHKSGLISMENHVIRFPNMWGKYINTEIGKIAPETFVGMLKPIEDFIEELRSNKSVLELICMKYRLSPNQAHGLRELFIKEQQTSQKHYKDYPDCVRHCNSWMEKNKHLVAANVTGTTVVSTGKLIG